jgi:SpoVK/Ycf46/Vps4 family AAA+-type ATPase
MVYPEDIAVSFDDVGGLESAKRDIFELVALPLRRPDLFRHTSRLVSAPKGILLYGPPGTGKTMMAKAMARESGAAFINLKMSTTMNKWFGESQKLIRATFSLAHKLAPCIIFIDEIDSFLHERSSQDHPASGNMKAEFMALWDGITTPAADANNNGTARDAPAYGVIVVGATNRPWDVDQAILRRMPRTFELGMPDAKERLSILHNILRHEKVCPELSASMRSSARNSNRETDALAAFCEAELEGYSGSDLKELCRAAAMLPFREYCDALSREHKSTDHSSPPAAASQVPHADPNSASQSVLRSITLNDLRQAAQVVPPTGSSANEYRQRTTAEGARRAAGSSSSSRSHHAETAALHSVLNSVLNGQSSDSGRHSNDSGGVGGGGRSGLDASAADEVRKAYLLGFQHAAASLGHMGQGQRNNDTNAAEDLD